MALRNILITFGIFIAVAAAADGQTPNSPPAAAKFDAALAKKTGADQFGMRLYVLCILKTGPKDSKIKGSRRETIFKGHMANIQKLAKEGKLALAGPFGKNDITFRGLFIFAVATVEEAKKLAQTDPVLSSGVMVAEFVPWYGSAALMEVNELHEKVAEKNF